MEVHRVPGIVQPQTPELAEVMQEPEPYSSTVPVCITEPVTTQELPAVLGTTFTVIAGTQSQVALNASRMRKKATLISTDNAFLVVSRRNNAATSGANVVWPANVPLVYTAQSELSVATTNGTATVSIITEDWSR